MHRVLPDKRISRNNTRANGSDERVRLTAVGSLAQSDDRTSNKSRLRKPIELPPLVAQIACADNRTRQDASRDLSVRAKESILLLLVFAVAGCVTLPPPPPHKPSGNSMTPNV